MSCMQRSRFRSATVLVQPQGVPACVKLTQCSTPLTLKQWLVTQNSAHWFSSLPCPAHVSKTFFSCRSVHANHMTAVPLAQRLLKD